MPPVRASIVYAETCTAGIAYCAIPTLETIKAIHGAGDYANRHIPTEAGNISLILKRNRQSHSIAAEIILPAAHHEVK